MSDIETKKTPDVSSTNSGAATEVRVGQIFGKDEYHLATLGYRQGIYSLGDTHISD